MIGGVFLLLIASVYSQAFTVEQLHQLRRVGGADVNAWGEVAYSLRTWDGKTVTNSLLKLSGGQRVVVSSQSGVSESNPAFLPPNFGYSLLSSISTRSGSAQVEIFPPGQSPYQLTNYPIDVENIRWFSGGLLMTMSVYTSCGEHNIFQCTADIDQKVAARGANTWKHYNSLFMRHWDEWETGKVSHIFLQKVKVDPATGILSLDGEPINLMWGASINSPVPPFGGLEQIDISPDGTEIAFTGQLVDHTSAWTTGWQTFIVPADGSDDPRSITWDNPARTTNPVYSPDGKYIAYLSMDRPGFEADRLHINLFDRQQFKTIPLTADIDISFSGITWSAGSDYILGDADWYGNHSIFAVPVNQNAPTIPVLIDAQTNTNLMRVPSTNQFFFLRNSMKTPTDVWVFNFSASSVSATGLMQVTFENKDLLAGIQMSDTIRFSFPGALGDTVYGWALKPYGYQEGQSYPTVQLVHGGPQGTWGDDWSYRWNPQLWAAHGYAVYMIDFHGSTGYGQAFTDAISGNWGSIPYWDIMNGTAYVVQTFPWMDPTKFTACGASYGGYMINWIQGHTDFFQALVTHDGIFDTTQGYYATEELWFPEWEFKGVPWEHPELYQKWNPANFVANWQTPHLIIHGQHDYRLPLNHGLSAFTALQRKGIASEFLYFTQENHWVLNDANGIKWYHTVLDWLDKWTS